MPSFGRAVLVTRRDSAGPEAGPLSTISSAVGGTFDLTVTEGPVAGPLDELARLQPASRAAAAAAPPIRAARGMRFLIVCSFSLSRRPPPQDFRCRKERAPPGPNLTK